MNRFDVEKDFYKILNVDVNATEAQIKKAYKTLAIIYHPDKNDSPEAEDDFKAINEAYSVLSDPHERESYDLSRAPPPPSSFNYPFDHFDPLYNLFGSPPKPYMTQYDPFGRTYRSFRPTSMPSSNPFVNPNDYNCSNYRSFVPPPKEEDRYRSFQKPADVKKRPNPTNVNKEKESVIQDPPFKQDCYLDLEELFCGCKKRLTISRQTFNTNSQIKIEDEIYEFDVEPGWRNGMKITFKKKDCQDNKTILTDIEFILQENPHSIFTRDNDNLKYKILLTQEQVFQKQTITISTLDNKPQYITLNSKMTFPKVLIIKGQGMPCFENPKERGNLIVELSLDS